MNIIVIALTLTLPAFRFSYEHTTLVINFIRSVSFCGFTTHLICFHIYLHFKKMSTIEFLLNRRNNQVPQRIENNETNIKGFEESNDESKIG